LVEFALLAIVTYMILAAILTFGHLLFCSQTLQEAADVAARELAHTPLLATANLMDVFWNSNPSSYSSNPNDTSVRTAFFDPNLLQFDMTANVPAGQSILDVVKTWPVVNQMLYPAMIVQPVTMVLQPGGNLPPGPAPVHIYLWYPGAVPCTDSTSPSRTVWCVAQVVSRTITPATWVEDQQETIEWVPVIEEMQPGTFSVVPPQQGTAPTQQGLVALRVNYGYQSATMSAYAPQPGWPPQPTPHALEADDSRVTVATTGNYTNYSPSGAFFPQSPTGTYSGPYGLGSQQAWGTLVRPFRRLLSMQAAYRREVFQ
jgi:hypothetical protein